MKIGLWLTARHDPGRPPTEHFAAMRAQVALARAAGFGMISSGQHYLSPRLQTFPLLARLAAEAGDMELATSILLLPLHNPVAVAEDAATMQAITDGRFMLGVGLGHDPAERTAFGVSGDDVAARFAEAIDVMRMVWSGDGRPFVGRFFALPERPAGPPLDAPGLWVGGNSSAARRRAAGLGAAWFPSSVAVDGLAEGRADHERLVDELGTRPPTDRPVGLWMHIDETDELARDAARRAGHLRDGRHERPGYVIGSPEHCVQALLAYRDQARSSHVLIRLEVPGLAQAEVLRRIERIGTSVIPQLGAE